MDKTLELLFGNEEGRTVRITVREPKDDISAEEVEQAMANVVNRDIFTSAGGSLIELKGARLVTRVVEEFIFGGE